MRVEQLERGGSRWNASKTWVEQVDEGNASKWNTDAREEMNLVLGVKYRYKHHAVEPSRYIAYG